MCSELCTVISVPSAGVVTATRRATCTSTGTLATSIVVLGVHRPLQLTIDPTIMIENYGPSLLDLV